MKYLNALCSALFIIIAMNLHAQTAPGTTNTPHCEIEQATKMAFETYPDLQTKSADNLKAFHQKIQNYKAGNVLIDDKVPVVFHLITPCENNFDFTKAFLEDVLSEVNADFTAQNTDEYNATIDPTFYTDQADIGITFKLAEIDPNGNPTDGITRSNSFYSNDGSSFQIPLKDIIQWNPSRYMNVWIVANVATSGYAQYPWTAETYPNLDGIVMSYDYVGENNINNRPHILTHEIGHWLGLLHTWGDFTTTGSCADPAPTYCDCDDFIADTPNCLGYNSISCPSNLPNSCTDPSNDRPDNIFNFMDYACEVMFTNDQKTRMLQVISAGTADRDIAVTSDTDPIVFMATNPDNSDAKLYLDQLVYTESFSNPGTIQEIGLIELRDCAGCSFSTNIGASFTTTGLPANIQSGLQITYLNNTQASISFNMTLTNAADHDAAADITNFSIDFNANAINGISNTSQVFNEASIKGLKIDFIDNETGLQANDFATASGYPIVETLTDGDFEAAYVPQVNDYVGFYNYQGGFYMYTASGLQMEAAVTGNGSYKVKRLTSGESLNSQVYQPITGGTFGGANELVVYDAGTYTDWLNQTGFVGVRVTTFCNEVYYVWIRIEVTNNELSLIDLVINTADNGQLNAGESPDCVPEGDDTSFLFLNSVNINQINNVSGDNGGYQFFSNYTTDLIEGTTYTVDGQGGFPSATQYDGEWRVYVDLGADGSYSDPGDLRYIVNQQTSINTGVELVPAGTLSGSSLNTTMMVIFSLYPLNGLCENYQYGETEEYNVTLKTSDTNCQIDETITTIFNAGDVQVFEVSDWILSTSTVRSGAEITFDAANYVHLNNGFSAETGADFIADIEGCGGGNGCVPTVPTLVDIDQPSASVYCDYAYGYCNNHQNDNKEFELTNLATGAVTSYFSTTHFAFFPNLTESTNYQYRVRKQCGTTGVFGGWSPYFAFTTIPCAGGCVPTVPTLADIDQTPASVYCDYAYGYCNNHPNDNKEFELTNLATGAVISYFSTTHFAYFPNLTASTNYQYRVRKQCGTTGIFGGWSPYFSFTTTACLASEIDGN